MMLLVPIVKQHQSHRTFRLLCEKICDLRARLVHSDGAHTALVTEHLYKGFLLVWWPEGDRTISMA